MSAAASSSLATSTSTPETEKVEHIVKELPFPAHHDYVMKEHNTLDGVIACFQWWTELATDHFDYDKVYAVFRDFADLVYNGGCALKVTDSTNEVMLKTNSDCCCRISCYIESPSKWNLAHFALRKGYYSNPVDGPNNELFTLMEKAFRLTTNIPCYICIDVHSSLGLVKTYVGIDETVFWLHKYLGMPKAYLQIETLINPDPSKHERVTILGFDLLNNTMNTYLVFPNSDKKLLCEIFRKAATLCGAESGLPEDITHLTEDGFIEIVLTYSFTTHQFVRVGQYSTYDIDAPNIDESRATPYIMNTFEKCKQRLGSVTWAKDPIKGCLPFSHFVVGHTYSRGGAYYVKAEPVQKACYDVGWKFLDKV